MKKIILSIALLGTLSISANPNGFNAPNFNWNNGNNGSNWNMPNFNWGNGNGYNNGSSWNMPNMNWGNNNRGSRWSMPGMNWGNGNNGFGSGTSWNMPNFNWGSGNGYNNGSSWSMPNMNWGNNWNNNVRPWNYGNGSYYGANRPGYTFVPNPNNAPVPPQAIPHSKRPVAVPPKPEMKKNNVQIKPAAVISKIPKPSEIKGIILAPENKQTNSLKKVPSETLKK